MADYQQTSYAEPNFYAPLGHVGEYTFCPLGHCGEEQIATLFSKVAVRGNPLLQGRRHAELMTLGRAVYRKALPLGLSQVVMYKGKPVALNTAWDSAEGLAWDDSELSMPDSMGADAAVAKACLNVLPVDDTTPTLFAAFVGVLNPHSRKLSGILGLTGQIVARAMGFKKSLRLSVLMNSVEYHNAAEDSEVRRCLPLHFADIKTDDEAVRAELAELGGVAHVSLMHCDDLTFSIVLPDELSDLSRKFASKQVERLRRRRSGMIFSNL